MLLQFLLVFAIQNGVFTFRIENGQSLEPLRKLIDLISKVNDNSKNDNVRYKTLGDLSPISLDYYDFSGLNSKMDGVLTSDLLRVEDNPTQDVRLHVIENPDVLEQYQHYLKDKNRHISSSIYQEYSPTIYTSISFDDITSPLRRNAVFRVDKMSNALNGPQKMKDLKFQRYNNHDTLTEIKFNDHFNKPKFETNDRDITTKKKDKSKRESKSIERDNHFGEDWFPKKEKDSFNIEENKIKPVWDADYTQKDKKSKDTDIKNSKYETFKIFSHTSKHLDSKPSRLGDNYKDHKPKKSNYKKSYETIKTDSFVQEKNAEFDYEPQKKFDNFKPNYKLFKSDYDEKPHKKVDYRNDNYDKPYKSNNYKVMKDDKPKSPRIKKFNDDDSDYKPRDKKYYYDRGGALGGKAIGRTPIPYLGHRGIYDDK